MGKRKTEFDITNVTVPKPVGTVEICDYEGEINVCVMVKGSNGITTGGHMRPKDLETFALNILKALGSNYLVRTPSQVVKDNNRKHLKQ